MKKTFNGDYKFRGYKIKKTLHDNYFVYSAKGEFEFFTKTLKDAQNEISKYANELKKAKIWKTTITLNYFSPLSSYL